MNPIRLTALALTSVLAFGALVPSQALADDRGRGHGGHGYHDRGPDRGRHDRHDDRRDDRHDYRERRQAYRAGYHDGRRDDRHYRPPVVYRPAPVVRYRPAPPPRYYGWAPGHRYHDYYRGPVYVVSDYDRYHVRRPPYGYHWVRDDAGNLLMVAIATGILADLVLHH